MAKNRIEPSAPGVPANLITIMVLAWKVPPHAKQFAHAPNEIASTIYIARACHHGAPPFGETNMPKVNKPAEKNKTMGDKSPKSNQKKSSQKQAQQSSADKQRQQALAAKTAAAKKKK